MNTVFRVNSRQRLIVTGAAMKKLLSFAQHRTCQPEAGGVLLGRHLLESANVVVDEVTTPQKSDKRSRFGFFRSKRHGAIARERWSAEAGTCAYLGLWHTHPEGDPVPSSADRLDWYTAVANDVFDGDRLFFLIVGTRNVRVWCVNRRGHCRALKESVRHD